MRNRKNGKSKTGLKITLLCLVFLALPATVRGGEAAPQKAGYLERIQEAAVGWWNRMKSAFAPKPADAPTVAQPGTVSSSPNSASPQALPRQGSSPAHTDPIPATTYVVGKEMVETVRAIAKRARITIEPVKLQPSLALPRPASKVAVSPIPQFTLRARRAVADLVPRLEPVAPVKPARRFDVERAKPAEIDQALLRRKPQLLAYGNKPLEKVDALPPDTLKLIRALFAWLLLRKDEGLSGLHELSKSTQSAVIRQKTLAFEGWMLEENNLPAFAAYAFWRSLAASPGGDDHKYATMTLSSLSRLARQTGLAKTAATDAALERAYRARILEPEARAFALLTQAERAFDKRAFAQARKLAKDVPAKSTWKEHARFLAAASLLGGATLVAKDAKSKDDVASLETAGRELTDLFRTVDDAQVFDATAVSLGRIHFILGNYKAAHQYLSQVSRETNLYIEAAVDNAWALLRKGDRNHAVGNMFTLHTPYFEGAYMPESYFLKSLGYQEICQFGDALTGVKQFKQRYSGAFRGLIDFNSGAKAPESAYYDDLLDYLAKRDTKLPGIVLRELGRHPEFLRRQKELNLLARNEAAIPRAFPRAHAPVLAWLKSGADSIESTRARHKSEMARFMKRRALEMEEELKFLMANISLLEYEIFAGAGQNLQLQGAQNFAMDEKAVPKRDFEEGKEYWPYEDEIWEDELNNFRSKIVDGCARAKKSGAGGEAERKPAS